MLTELVRLPGSNHGEFVKRRHGIRIESVDFRDSVSSDAIEVTASSEEPCDAPKDHRKKDSEPSSLHDCNLHLAGMRVADIPLMLCDSFYYEFRKPSWLDNRLMYHSSLGDRDDLF